MFMARANGDNQIGAIAKCARNCLEDMPDDPELVPLVKELLADATKRVERVEITYASMRRQGLLR